MFTAVFVSRPLSYQLSGTRQLQESEHLGACLGPGKSARREQIKGLVSKSDGASPVWQDSMEFLKTSVMVFLGKKWPFIIASLLLTVAGFARWRCGAGTKPVST